MRRWFVGETTMGDDVMRARSHTYVAWTLFAAGIVAWAMALVLDSPPYTTASDRVWASSFLALMMVGLFLSLRVPKNVFGWLLLIAPGLIGAGIGVGEAGNVVVGNLFFVLGMLVTLTALYLFPDGRLPSKLWRGIWLTGFALLSVISRFVAEASREPIESVGVGLIVVGALGSMIHRAVKGGPVARRQIGLPLLVICVGLFAGFATGLAGLEGPWLDLAPILIVTLGVPAAIAVAVLRYRLYDIEKLISRTLSYAVLVSLLGAVYFGLVTLISTLSLFENSLAVAGATLAVAAVFNPLRRRIQHAVDRRFNRSGYQAEMVSESFAAELQQPHTSEDLVELWNQTVSESFHPESIGFWFKPDPARTAVDRRA